MPVQKIGTVNGSRITAHRTQAPGPSRMANLKSVVVRGNEQHGEPVFEDMVADSRRQPP